MYRPVVVSEKKKKEKVEVKEKFGEVVINGTKYKVVTHGSASSKSGDYVKKKMGEFLDVPSIAPGFTTLVAPSQVAGTSVMIVDTQLDSSALNVAIATFFSNLLFKNVIGADEQNLTDIVEGLAWLLTSIVTLSSGGVANVVEIPVIFDLLLTLLKEKKVKLLNGTIHYTPTWSPLPGLNYSFATPSGAIYTFTVPSTGSLSPINYAAVPGSVEHYAKFLKIASGIIFARMRRVVRARYHLSMAMLMLP